MAKDEQQQAWWESLPAHAGGDMIVGTIGQDAIGAIGKNIVQQASLGAPTPDDKQIIEQKLAAVRASLQQAGGQLDPTIANVAQVQLTLLQGELTKTGPGEAPSANTIKIVGDWLLDNVPQIADALTSLFLTPAVGKVVALAGELAVTWVKARFGKTP